jgi:dihydroorotate dehydrogenase (NAD+) catalytic subunit
VEDAGGDAIVAINTLKAMVIVPEFGKPLLSNKVCGLSGKCIKPIGVRAVWDLYNAVSIPIVGVGGICDYRDAVEYIMAGASAFQIGSAILTEGVDVFEKINGGLVSFMKEYDYKTIEDMRGVAHE